MKMVRCLLLMLAALMLPSSTFCQTYNPIPPAIKTPDNVETNLGALTFKDGMPTPDTVAKVYDQLDYLHGVEAFMNALPAVSQYAIHKAFLDAGIRDNEVLIFSRLMDSRSLFLTANADTIYFWTFLDLSKGFVVVEAPPGVLSPIDDIWWRWVIDIGLPGPDRGEGGKYLFVPPGYAGLLPEGGYFIGHSKTTRVSILGRAFLENNDPAPAVARIKSSLKIYPYKAGGFGSSIGAFLNGKGPLGTLATPIAPRFVEGQAG
jgi:hypothetical protein